jgi:hypothetical protein
MGFQKGESGEWTPARSTQPANVLAQELLSARVKVLLTSSPPRPWQHNRW